MNFVFYSIDNNDIYRFVGPVAAYATGDFVLNGIEAKTTININQPSNRIESRVGGLIGKVSGTVSQTATISSITLNSTFNSRHKSSSGQELIGGCIGYVDNNKYTMTIDDITLKSSYVPQSYSSGVFTNNNNSFYAGFICSFAPVANNNGNKGSTLNFTNINVKGERITHYGKEGDRGSNIGNGGLLGYCWPDVDVNIGEASDTNGLVIGTTGDSTNSPTIIVKAGQSLAGLVYKATGE
jgi:hypothetical protein